MFEICFSCQPVILLLLANPCNHSLFRARVAKFRIPGMLYKTTHRYIDIKVIECGYKPH